MQPGKSVYPLFQWHKLLIFSVLLISVSSCKKDDSETPAPVEDRNKVITYTVPSAFPYPTVPADNQPTRNRIELGKKLFEDVILSQNNTISCSSCHKESSSFIDGLRVSTGINGHVGTRNALTALNAAYLPSLLWDGKFPSLEDQVIGPIENTLEMGSDVNVIVTKLQNDPTYPALFQEAYGEGPTISTLKKAVACFERTLYSANSKYDSNTLTTSEQNGKALFFGKANCSSCHSGFMFSNFNFENDGMFTVYADSGRASITHSASDVGKFRVPSLRNVSATAPYMHDGKMTSLEAIVDVYNTGGYPNPNKSSLIQPLNLTTQEKQDLVNFLKAI